MTTLLTGVPIPPGDPGALAAGARTLAALVDVARTSANQVGHTAQVPEWKGRGANAYRGDNSAITSFLSTTSESLVTASLAMSAYSRDLAHAQDVARQANIAIAQANTTAVQLDGATSAANQAQSNAAQAQSGVAQAQFNASQAAQVASTPGAAPTAQASAQMANQFLSQAQAASSQAQDASYQARYQAQMLSDQLSTQRSQAMGLAQEAEILARQAALRGGAAFSHVAGLASVIQKARGGLASGEPGVPGLLALANLGWQTQHRGERAWWQPPPKPKSQPWWDQAIGAVGNTFAAGYHATIHAGEAFGQGLWNFVSYDANHPGQGFKVLGYALASAGGALLFIAGSAGDAAGGALTLTGVGAVIGVPLDVVSTTAVVAGGTAAVGFAVKGGQELATMNSLAQDANQPSAPMNAVETRVSQAEGKIGRAKGNLDPPTLDAARRELQGEVVATKPDGTPFDHVNKVTEAQGSLRTQISNLKAVLGDSRTDQATRQQAEGLLSQASKLLDYSEQFVL